MTRFAPPVPHLGRSRSPSPLPPDIAALLDETEQARGAETAALHDEPLPGDLGALLDEPLPPNLAALLDEPLPPDLAALHDEHPMPAVGEFGGGGHVVGVVAPAGLILAAAGGVAGWLRRHERAGVALVVLTEPVGAHRPIARPASALARRLAGRGFAASASAGLCRVTVPADPLVMVAETRRLLACVEDDVPVVIGLASRDDEADALLADADELVLALPSAVDDALADLARASLDRVGPPVREVRVPTDPVGRRVAALGLRPLEPRPDDVAP